MTSYPGGVYSPRSKNNKSGVVYDAGKDTVGYAEDVTKLDDEVVAVETELGANPKGNHASVVARLNDGAEVIAAPGSDHVAKGIKIEFTADVTLAFGEVGFLDSDGEVAKGDADVIASASCVVMCAEAEIAADASGMFLLLGVARDDTWTWTPGGLLYLDTATAGGMTQTPPSGTDEVIQIIGVATHADRILFNPSLVQVEHT